MSILEKVTNEEKNVWPYVIIYGNRYVENKEETNKEFIDTAISDAVLDFLKNIHEEYLNKNGELPTDWYESAFWKITDLELNDFKIEYGKIKRDHAKPLERNKCGQITDIKAVEIENNIKKVMEDIFKKYNNVLPYDIEFVAHRAVAHIASVETAKLSTRINK